MTRRGGKKADLIRWMDTIAPERDRWIRLNASYYRDLVQLLSQNIPPGSSVLEIGCGTGYLLNELKPGRGVGIDISSGMLEVARRNYPHLEFCQMDAENLTLTERFDVVILSDALGYFEDIQQAFRELKKVSTPQTRIIFTYHSFLWNPLLTIAEKLHLKMAQKRLSEPILRKWVSNQVL